MSPDITIRISTPDGGVTAGAATTAEASPGPIPIEQLQANAVGEAPGPAAIDAITESSADLGTGPPPGPMPIEQLLGSQPVAAPVPEPLAALDAAGGLPTPLPPEALAQSQAGPPAPQPIEALGKPAAAKKTGARRPTRGKSTRSK